MKNYNNLILYAIFSLSNKREKCFFENITKECFTLFPETFSLFRYPKWPDARKIDRPLRKLKQKGIIKKDRDSYYSFTKKGEKRIKEVVATLKQGKLNF